MKIITERQKEIVGFIADFTETRGYPPTVREISEHFEVSLKAIQDHLAALEKKHCIEIDKHHSRAIRVLIDDRQKRKVFVNKIPLLGTIAAGKPLLSEENLDGYVSIAEPFVKPGKSYFALRVRGESMVGAGILEGDLAVVEQTSDAVDGQIVVAVIENAITLKRFYREDARIRLQPENPAFEPIYVENPRIVGTLANILRTY